MNKLLDKKIIIFVIILLCLIQLVLAVPNSMNVRGKLTSTSGAIQTGTFNFTFRIYDNITSGNMLYEKPNITSTTDARGVYDIILNNVNITFDKQLYLGVEVSADGEMSPRVNLTSVPYSFMANTSEELDVNRSYTVLGLNVTENLTLGDKITFRLRETIDNLVDGFLRIGGSVNITESLIVLGGVNVSGDLSISQEINLSAIGDLDLSGGIEAGGGLNVSGDLSVNQQLNITASTGNLITAGDIDASGTISAGTLQAVNTFNVGGGFGSGGLTIQSDGDIVTGGDILFSGNITIINVTHLSVNGSVIPKRDNEFDIGNDSLRWRSIYAVGMNLTSNNLELLGNAYIGGNVGIGTTSPNDALEVIGNVRISGSLNASSINATIFVVKEALILGWTNLTNYPASATCGPGQFVNAIGDTISCTSPAETSSAAGGWANTTTTTATSLDVNVASGAFYVNASTNNVGIGTTLPTELLVVAGNVNVTGNLIVGADGSGKVGIGTTSPQYLLQVANASNAVNLSGILYINSTSGNVGIGTTSPSEKLEVVGNVSVTDGTIQNLGEGGLLCKAYNDTGHVGTFKGKQIRQWIASTIDFSSMDNLVGQADYYTIRCVGYVRPLYSETYYFNITTDDGARLWVDGKQLVDSWVNQAPTDHGDTISLTANNWYPIIIEHYENTGGQRLELNWSSASQSEQVVPSSALAFSAHEFGTNYFFSNVGIGTSLPNYLLQVASGTDGRSVNLSNVLYVNGSSGNVGIGTANPSNELEVNGDIELTNLFDNDGSNFFDGTCSASQGVQSISSTGAVTCQTLAVTDTDCTAGQILLGDGTCADNYDATDDAVGSIAEWQSGCTNCVGNTDLAVNSVDLTSDALSAAYAGAGLTGGGASALAVGAGSCITINANDAAVTNNCVDATTVDSINAASFLRSDADDVGTGSYTFSGDSPVSYTDTGTVSGIKMDSSSQKRITWNDGGGNFNIRSGSYFSGTNKYVVTGDGASDIIFSSDSVTGAIVLRTAGTGTADNTITYANTITMSTTSTSFTDVVNLDATGSALTSDGDITLTGSGDNLIFSSTGSITLAGGTISDSVDGVDIADNLEVSGDITAGDDIFISEDGLIGISASTERIVFDGTAGEIEILGANVGIGDTSLTYALEVNGVILGQSIASSGDVLRAGNDAKLVDVDIADTLGIYGLQDSTKGHIKLGSSGPTISGVSGNVGIGTTSPSHKLNVVGAVNITSILYLGNGIIQNTKGSIVARVGDNSGTFGFVVQDSDAGAMAKIDSDGNANFKGCLRVDSGGAECSETEGLVVDGNVGIGTTNPLSTLSVGGDGNSNYAIHGSGAAYGVYGTGSSGGLYGYTTGTYGLYAQGGTYGVFTTTTKAGGYGVYAQASSTTSTAVYGKAYASSGTTYGVKGQSDSASGYDFYAAGAGTDYGPFTGGHETKLSSDFPENIKSGMIVSVTGKTEKRYLDNQIGISSTLPTIELSNSINDKKVLGAFTAYSDLGEDHWYINYSKLTDRFATVNSLGEGRVWISDINGNVEAGDYITTSEIAGYGMKQNDDLLHSYTLGKSTENIDWNSVSEIVEFEGEEYKVYLIAVVYTSG